MLQPAIDLYKKKEAEGFASGPLSINESYELIIQLIKCYSVTTIIINALDECNPDTRYDLLEAFDQICKNSSKQVKIFISSRDDLDIKLHLESCTNLEIDSKKNSEDIASYVINETSELIQKRKLLLFSQAKKEMESLIISTVIKGATGM